MSKPANNGKAVTPTNAPANEKDTNIKRAKLSQSDVPSVSLEQALRIPRAIIDNYASQPTDLFDIASALVMTPSSGQFRSLTGAALAYGLTTGGAYAEKITVTELAKRICLGSDTEAITSRREALLKPRIISQFLSKYDGSPLPSKDDIAHAQLVSMGVPKDRASKVYELILESAQGVGFLQELKGKKYIRLNSSVSSRVNEATDDDQEETPAASLVNTSSNNAQVSILPTVEIEDAKRKRVFITHGKNRAFLEPIKRFLEFGEMNPVVSVEKQSVSEPVPDKVMNEMRSCGAAIIHVDEDQKLIDNDGKSSVVLNANVLIEIGAAMALYGRRFILLVKDGITLPSNLQGLFEVRYQGDALDSDATMRLLDAIKAMKGHA